MNLSIPLVSQFFFPLFFEGFFVCVCVCVLFFVCLFVCFFFSFVGCFFRQWVVALASHRSGFITGGLIG